MADDAKSTVQVYRPTLQRIGLTANLLGITNADMIQRAVDSYVEQNRERLTELVSAGLQ